MRRSKRRPKRPTRLTTPAGAAAAAIIVLAALPVAWLAVRTTAVEALSSRTTQITPLIATKPEVVLGTATAKFVAARLRTDPRLLPAIKAAAAARPLDARPYLLIGSDYLRTGDTARAVATLEAGRRLDPRQRIINLLLLEHYLRAGQYAAAADEFSVLARLVGEAQSPIATALAQMSLAPQTRNAAQMTLRQNIDLERAVLNILAGGNTPPAAIFAMASPTALAGANLPGGWGSTLVDRLVKQHRYGQARAVWQRINRLTDQQVALLLYDGDVAGLPGSPPFTWKLANDSVAAVDLRGGKVNIDYYGRDSGDLLTQLLVLAPGTYRFSYVVNGQQQAASGSGMTWSVTCDNAPDRTLARLAMSIPSAPRRAGFTFTVPPDCPAQWLRLNGLASEFPQATNATIDTLHIDKVATS